MRAVLKKIAEEPSMIVFSQGQNNWMIHHFVSQKMYSKQKFLRKNRQRLDANDALNACDRTRRAEIVVQFPIHGSNAN